MHPGVGFPLERYVPKEGAVICGFNLPANVNISMSAPVVHHDKAIFGDDAEVFRPDRWIEALPEQLKCMERAMLSVRFPLKPKEPVSHR
jgi:cytochrome P450